MQDFEYTDAADPLEGKIIARMPDLGQRTETPKRNRNADSAAFSEHIGKATVLYSPVEAHSEGETRTETQRRSFVRDLFLGREFFSTRVIAVAIILVLCLGGTAVHKLEKKKRKIRDREIAVQKAEEKIRIAEETKKEAEKSAAKPAVKPAAKPANPVSSVAKTATPVVKPEEKKPEEKPVAAAAAAKPKPVETPKPAPAAAAVEPVRPVEVAGVAGAQPPAKMSDSPWERPADNYSPWAMNTSERLKSNAAAPAEPQYPQPPAANPYPVNPQPQPAQQYPQQTGQYPQPPAAGPYPVNPYPYPQPAQQYPQQTGQYPQQYPQQYPAGQPVANGPYPYPAAAAVPAPPAANNYYQQGTAVPVPYRRVY
ncbi:MAG: hypothetical protein LBN39_12740 [Planctomycetaceae bacterium]|jgi:hypothetical protein|nr:hypothetical protein [Planctomycetaceae bacterium]